MLISKIDFDILCLVNDNPDVTKADLAALLFKSEEIINEHYESLLSGNLLTSNGITPEGKAYLESNKIDNAIIKKDKNGNIKLIDPENIFKDEDDFLAVISDDLITLQLLINGILANDFQNWRELGTIPENEPLKSLFVRLGYSREDISTMLKEF